MSFYGNILNRIDKAFSKIRVNGKDIEATHEKDILSLKGENGIKLSNVDKEITIDGSAFITKIIEDKDEADNALKYDFYNDKDKLIGSINIPLDLILDSAKLSEDGKTINLTFKTAEGKSQIVDIDVADLYNADELEALDAAIEDLQNNITDLQNQIEETASVNYDSNTKTLTLFTKSKEEV